MLAALLELSSAHNRDWLSSKGQPKSKLPDQVRIPRPGEPVRVPRPMTAQERLDWLKEQREREGVNDGGEH